MATRKTPAKKPATSKKSKAPQPAKANSRVARKPLVKAANKVDYYPNRMTVAISALAGTLLVLFALIAVLGLKS